MLISPMGMVPGAMDLGHVLADGVDDGHQQEHRDMNEPAQMIAA